MYSPPCYILKNLFFEFHGLTAALQSPVAAFGNDELGAALCTAISLTNYISHNSIPSLLIQSFTIPTLL
jgi:hypothetical protein